MRTTKIVEAWMAQRTESAHGLRTVGPTLFVGTRPVASWIDKADETGAQIALCVLRVDYPWLKPVINDAVDKLRGTILEVPCPLPIPTPAQHAENIGHLLARWKEPLLKAARSKHYASGNYSAAQRNAASAELYAWAFNLSKPRPAVPPEIFTRARQNAEANRSAPIAHPPSPDMLRAMWRAGRKLPDASLGPIMLRLSPSKKYIETSRGERLPADKEYVAMVWTLACECRHAKEARTWRVVSERPRVDKWAVRSIDADGSLQIGCDAVAFAEVARIAVALGVS